MCKFSTFLIYILLFIAIIPSFSLAETWQELSNRADSLEDVKNIDSALIVSEIALREAHADEKAADSILVSLTNKLAGYHLDLGNFKLSDSIYNAALTMAEERLGKYHRSTATIHYNIALNYNYFQGRYPEGLEHALMALNIAKEIYKKEDTALIMFLRMVGGSYEVSWRYDKVVPFNEEAYDIAKNALGDQDSITLRQLDELGFAYNRSNEYIKAKSCFDSLYASYFNIYGFNHEKTAQSLTRLGDVYIGLNKTDSAEISLKKAVSIYEDQYGEDNIKLGESLDYLAYFYIRTGKFKKAEPVYLRLVSIVENAINNTNNDLDLEHLKNRLAQHIFQNVSYVYTNLGDIKNARKYTFKSYKLLKEVHGPDNPKVGDKLLAVAGELFDMGEYEKCIDSLKRALEIDINYFGPRHVETAEVKWNLAHYHMEMDNIVEAEKWMDGILESYVEYYGHESEMLGMPLSMLGTINERKGEYDRAEYYYKKHLEIAKNIFPENSERLATPINNLAVLYGNHGRFAEQLKMHKESFKINESHYGADNFKLVTSLNNLGVCYLNLNQPGQSKELFERALKINEKVYGPYHLETAKSIAQVASSFRYLKKYDIADSLYSEAVKIIGQNIDSLSSDYWSIYNKYGIIKTYLYEYNMAEKYFNLALSLNEISDLPEQGGNCINLGTVYRRKGQYDKAEKYLAKGLALKKRFYGEKSIGYAIGVGHYGVILNLTGKLEKALDSLSSAVNIYADIIYNNMKYMSERNALTFSHDFQWVKDKYLSCFIDQDNLGKHYLLQTINIAMSGKGVISDGMLLRNQELNVSENPETQFLIDGYNTIKYQLSQLFVKGPGNDLESYKGKLDSLTSILDEIEYELTESDPNFGNIIPYNIESGNVVDNLPKNSVLVDYIKYDHFKYQSDSTIKRYIVVIISSDGKKDIIEIGEASQIDSLIYNYQRHLYKISLKDHPPLDSDKKDYYALANQIYKEIINPLEVYLKNKKVALISPDGALNLISFAGLIDNEGRYLIEKYPIHYLTAGRDLIRLNEEVESGNGLLAMGNPNFDATLEARLGVEDSIYLASIESEPYHTRNTRSGCGDLREIQSSPLPHTLYEINQVNTNWNGVGADSSIIFFRNAATEDNFKAFAPGKSAIHIATHGYYLEGSCNPEQKYNDLGFDRKFYGENPLLLSGLLFAGSNLHGDGAESAGLEDGYLSAYEVSAMDLKGTDLVVLSACETGLGEVKQGEGIYGLRRAFQLAGARTIVSSLWQVPDKTTSEMMSQLYQESDRPIYERIREMQLSKIIELRSESFSDHPYNWAAFIAIGDWR